MRLSFQVVLKSKKDVGTATVIGLISVLVIYFLMTVLAQGVIQQNHISELSNPSMAAVLEHIVGHWGSVLVNIGLIISVLGAWLGWTLLAGELPFVVAKDGLFPKWFAKENKNKAPVNSLLITNILVQIFLISMLFTESAYQFAFFSSAGSDQCGRKTFVCGPDSSGSGSRPAAFFTAPRFRSGLC